MTAAWLDDFFQAFYRRRPVHATFVGVHAYDDRLPDLSEAGLASLASEATELLARLHHLPAEPLSGSERMDRELAEGFLEIQAWEAASPHFGWGNPTLHTGEAIFGILSLLLRPFAPLSERLDLVAARLEGIPRLLDDGRATLHDTPIAWCARARRECAGAGVLLGDGLDRLLRDEHVVLPGLRRAADSARQAFVRFDALIQSDLLPTATQAYACGAEAFDLLLRRGHFLAMGADELERLALDRIAEEASALAVQRDRERLAQGRSEKWAQSVASAGVGGGPDEAGGHPAGASARDSMQRARYLDRFSELWRTAGEAAERRDVLTVPDWPVRYVEQPAWLRESAACFYFLPYRSPAPFDATPVVDYFVPATADDSTIKLNHVVHHGSLGHHAQNWHAARSTSRVGQMAAVDCAARIAMLCGGTLAEGWACYATDLAEEIGLLTPAECFGQHSARLRMAARAVVDIRFHQGRMSLEEAADYYRQHVGMSAAAAYAEALKNSLFPGAACMYLAGWDGIWRLRRQFAGKRNTSLRQFHDQLLSYGSVPVSLVERAMGDANSLDSTVLVKR